MSASFVVHMKVDSVCEYFLKKDRKMEWGKAFWTGDGCSSNGNGSNSSSYRIIRLQKEVETERSLFPFLVQKSPSVVVKTKTLENC